MNSFDICRLCGEPAELQQSHILPAAAHAHTKSNGLNVLIGNRKEIFRPKNQTDFKERLLCFNCEQRLSNFEGVAINACRLAWRNKEKGAYQIPPATVAPLVKFAYSVFWRASVAKCMESYTLLPELELELKEAFFNETFPSTPRLAISMSFLKVLDIPMTGRLLFTPLIAALPVQTQAHYFSILGIVFRMNVPHALYEIEKNYFLRPDEQEGYVYPLQLWEERLIDSELTVAAMIAKSEGARPIHS